jgi:hypothetical protein
VAHRTTRWGSRLLLVCGILFGIFGIVTSAATLDDALWAAQSFQRLAALDVPAAQEIWMTSDAGTQWTRLTEDVFADPLDAAAFFGNMLWLPSQGPVRTWLVGLVNPWVGAVLVFQFNDAATAIIGFDIRMTSPTTLADESLADLEGSIRDRFAAAVSTFSTEIGAWPRRGAPEADPASWPELAYRIRAYREETRRLLSPDGFSVWEDARANLSSAQDILVQDVPTGVLDVAGTLPANWRQMAIPVWASEHSDSLNVVWSSDADPYMLLWMSIKTRVDAEPLHDAAVLDIIEIYTAAQGGGS